MTGQTYLLWSHKHQMWWRPDECGYTSVMAEAGRYSWWDAVRLVTRSADHGDPNLVSVMVTAPDVRAVDGAETRFVPFTDRSGHQVWATGDGLVEWTDPENGDTPGDGWVRLYRPAGGVS